MYICMYMCVCIYIHIYVYTYVYVYIYIYQCILGSLFLYISECVGVWVCELGHCGKPM